MMVANITHTVMVARCWVASAMPVDPPGLAACPREGADERAKAAPVPGVDLDSHAHAGSQARSVARLFDRELHRHALDNLDPVARCVLRRQHRKFSAGRRTDAGDRGLPGDAWVGIN